MDTNNNNNPASSEQGFQSYQSESTQSYQYTPYNDYSSDRYSAIGSPNENTPILSATRKNKPVPESLGLMDPPEGGYEFSYEDPVRSHRHHLMVTNNQLTVEFEDPLKRYQFVFSSFLYNATHLNAILLRPKRLVVYDKIILLSCIYWIVMLLSLIFTWKAVSPARNVYIYAIACVLGLIPFLFVLIAVAITYVPYIRNLVGEVYVDPPKREIGLHLYRISAIISLGILIAAVVGLALLDSHGNQGGYYWHYIECNENSYSPDSPPYVFKSLCDDEVRPWTKTLASFTLTGVVVTIAAQILYFGQLFPFSFVDVTDRKNNPMQLTFYGAKAAGFPVTVALAKKDAEHAINLFHKLHEHTKAPSLRVTSAPAYAWVAHENLENRDSGYLGMFGKFLLKMISFGHPFSSH